jgi:hypothetical protein
MAVEFVKVGAHDRVRIQIIGSYGIGIEGQHCSPGDVVDCSASDAVFLIGRKVAKRYEASPVVAAPPVSQPTLAEEPEPEATPKRARKPVAVGK